LKLKKQPQIKKKRTNRLKARKDERKKHRKLGRAFIRTYRKQLGGANLNTERDYRDYIKSIKIGKDAMKFQEN